MSRPRNRMNLLPWLAASLVLSVGCAAGSPPAVRPFAPLRSAPRAWPEPPADPAPPWRTEVASTAERMIGSPYRYGGQSPGGGFDCSGLVAYSYGRAGFHDIPRTARALYRRSTAVPLEQLQPGDLLFFSFGRPDVSHVAIYIGEGRFVHAHKTGRSVEQVRLDDPYWSRVIRQAGRLPDP